VQTRGWGFVFTLSALLVLAACGGSEPVGNGTEGAGGAANDAGISSGTDASSGGSTARTDARGKVDPTTASPYAACVHFLQAECNRRFYECQGAAPVADPCPGSPADECPDLFFSKGSHATVEKVLACADKWQAAPCDELNRDIFPTCGFDPGDLQKGQPCLYASQCASSVCGHPSPLPNSPDCRQCGTIGVVGDDCVNQPVSCGSGLECTGKCTTSIQFGLQPGAACERYGQCVVGYYCVMMPGETAPKCQKLPTIGMHCPLDVERCEKGAYCNAAKMCEAVPQAGQPCAGQLSSCTADSFCDMKAAGGPTCTLYKQAGEPCFYGATAIGGTTVPGCAPGLFCKCNDDACTASTCFERRREGEACGDARAWCTPGTECKNGVCMAVALQGLFDKACASK
jgi:hypothetical protein